MSELESLRSAKPHDRPVVILGGGINGAATARELVLCGAPVCVVDEADLAGGATSASSRLIHGGLRYLEYGDTALVRESLAERDRLLRLAPDFVRPLRLFIPVRRRLGGLTSSALRFLHLPAPPAGGRGEWAVRTGLWLYDRLAGESSLPRRGVHALGGQDAPPVDAGRYRAVCSYWDAQVAFPERLVLALLADAQSLARKRGLWFRVLPYHQARLAGKQIEIRPREAAERAGAGQFMAFEPAAVVNATGAWVDETLARLEIPSPRLMAGTKGSHLVTWHEGLREALVGGGVYAEAGDGRPVFLLPLAGGALVGTTDLPHQGSPRDAVAEESEIDYLVEAVQSVFPQIGFSRRDVAFTTCGVRPLPSSAAGRPAAITRRHRIEHHADAPCPLLSLIGGKLTTCRSLAEETAAFLFGLLGRKAAGGSRQRPLAERTALTPGGEISIDDGPVRRLIEDEWVTSLADLVERRLMLFYRREFSPDDLKRLALLMVDAGRLSPQRVAEETTALERRLAR